mmetsp:Transcript_48348/g.104740  ORF Transcript_48348/g.104740 Transcript_48348/m.104740 type:complete len:427 (+) Transcript_48348:161-1441(+)
MGARGKVLLRPQTLIVHKRLMLRLAKGLALLFAVVSVQARRRDRGGGRHLDGRSDLAGVEAGASTPRHKTDCSGRPCRPGEGSLTGYEHWKQPYPHDESIAKRLRTWPNDPSVAGGAYTPLVAAARRVAADNFVVFTVADFDYRYIAENWYVAARRAGMSNMLVHAIDSEALSFLSSRGVAVSDGSASFDAWQTTRLDRHIQRTSGEQHAAAAALVSAGLDVLLTDATHVILRPLTPFFKTVPTSNDMLVMRDGCDASRNPVSCGGMWNFLFLRGSNAETRALTFAFIEDAVRLGMVDFYLRWWAGHHCIFVGYQKHFKQNAPALEQPLDPAAYASHHNATLSLVLHGARACHGARCLTLGLLPAGLFPAGAADAKAKPQALVRRSARPDAAHRLRLDRYDERDFDNLTAAMKRDGLWLLPDGARR